MNNQQNNLRRRRRLMLFSLWITATIVLCIHALFSIYESSNPDSLLGVFLFWVLVAPLSVGLMFLFERALNTLFPIANPDKSKARASLLCGILSIVIRFPIFFIIPDVLMIIIVVGLFTVSLFFGFFGIVLSKSARKGGYVGRMATAGFVCSIIGIAFWVLNIFSSLIIHLLNIDLLEELGIVI